MFNGMITFSAREDDGQRRRAGAGADPRAGPAVRDGDDVGGHRKEDKHWTARPRRSSRAHFGVEAQGRRADAYTRRQEASVEALRRNIRKSAAIRSARTCSVRPFRAIAKPFKREDEAAAMTERAAGRGALGEARRPSSTSRMTFPPTRSTSTSRVAASPASPAASARCGRRPTGSRCRARTSRRRT